MRSFVKPLLIVALLATVLMVSAVPARADFGFFFPDATNLVAVYLGDVVSAILWIDVPGDFDVFLTALDSFGAIPVEVSLAGFEFSYAYWLDFIGIDFFSGFLVFDVYVYDPFFDDFFFVGEWFV
jgi:hypothetical protein